MSIDLHSAKPCFSVQFVHTYSIHSLPPPSRRTQQIQPFSQSGAGVCPKDIGPLALFKSHKKISGENRLLDPLCPSLHPAGPHPRRKVAPNVQCVQVIPQPLLRSRLDMHNMPKLAHFCNLQTDCHRILICSRPVKYAGILH